MVSSRVLGFEKFLFTVLLPVTRLRYSFLPRFLPCFQLWSVLSYASFSLPFCFCFSPGYIFWYLCWWILSFLNMVRAFFLRLYESEFSYFVVARDSSSFPEFYSISLFWTMWYFTIFILCIASVLAREVFSVVVSQEARISTGLQLFYGWNSSWFFCIHVFDYALFLKLKSQLQNSWHCSYLSL